MVIISKNDDGTGGQIHVVDVIEYDNKLWLVPEWLDYTDAKVTMPARIVCLDLLRHERPPSDDQDIVVSDPIPKSVFDGHVPPGIENQYLVIERPDIRLPLQTLH